MQFEDLSRVLHVSKSQNIHISAAELNITVGALSKTIKKIEAALNSTLFDRVGRNIQLNSNGEKFCSYAANLLHEYEQMRSEFIGTSAKQIANLSGPSVLINYCLETVMDLMPNNIELTIDTQFEGQAITSLLSGQSDIAIVTNDALTANNQHGVTAITLGTTSFSLVCSTLHPLASRVGKQPLLYSDIKEYAFVCPTSSPFCGVKRGVGSDGWPDHVLPRHISCRTDDFNMLLSLVNQGKLLAYVPDFVIQAHGLQKIDLVEFQGPHSQPNSASHLETYSFLFRPSMASGWLNNLAHQLEHQLAHQLAQTPNK